MLLASMNVTPLAISMLFSNCILTCIYLAAVHNIYNYVYAIMVTTWCSSDCALADLIGCGVRMVVIGY